MILKTFSRSPLDVNCYLVADESSRQAAIIDPGYYHPQLAKFIKEKELEPLYILLTHAHGDHFCGVPSFRKKYPSIQVAAHPKEAELLANGTINFSEEVSGRPVCETADLWVKEGDVLKLGGLSLRILETPGHSPGSISILADNYLFSGDTLLRRSIGRCDLPGGNLSQLLEAVKNKLFLLPDDTIILPGHMGETSIGYEKLNNPFLV